MSPDQQLKLFRMKRTQILQQAITALQALREEVQGKLSAAVKESESAELKKLIAELGEDAEPISKRVRFAMNLRLVKK